MKLSIVTTLYFSEVYIEEFFLRATKIAKQYASNDYEIIMVNDGSPDSSLEIATSLTKYDKHLKVIELSKNFGHHKAMMTGLMYAQGEEVFLIDVDLEEDPEWLIPFSKMKKEQKLDVVYGVQEKRKGGLFEKWSGALFYKVFNTLTSIKHPESPTTARLMSKKYVTALTLHQEQAVAFFCLCALIGFNQREYIVTKKNTSPTTYSLLKKIKLAFIALTSFSSVFLKIIFWLGLCISLFSFAIILYIFINSLFNNFEVLGWASIMSSIWFLSGIILMSLGVIGLYLSKIFAETKGRPYTIVKSIHINSSSLLE